MSYNGSGVFNINTAGQPVVTGTVISSTAFNALTADLATGLTTALTKDGQTTPTANIPMGGFKITGIAAATTLGDALSYGRAATVSTLTNSALTSGRVTYATTAGLLTDSASLRFDGTSIGVGGAPTVNSGQTSVTVNGTSNARLDMQIGGTNTAGLVVSSSAAYLQTLTAIPLIFNTNSAEVARFDSSGNLGIGTTSPTATLHVYQSASGSTAARLLHVNGNGILVNPSYNYYDAYNHIFRSLNGTTTEMTLDASGNLGIGMTPTNFGNGYTVLQVANATNGGMLYLTNTSNAGGRIYGNTAGLTHESFGATYQAFNTNSTERMRIDSSGNVGIGATPAANYKLSVSSSSTSINAIFAENTDASFNGDVVDINATRNATGGEYSFLVCSISGVAVKLKIANSGNVTNTNGSYGAISDAKLKENIVDATPKLADLMQVKVRNYNMINDTTKQIGVVAQELETVFPNMIDETPDYEDVITTDEDGKETTERVLTGTKTKSVKYSVFVPMLIKAMQEQQAIIESLNARLTKLESK